MKSTPKKLNFKRANLSVFRTFIQFALVWFCLFPLGVWEGLRFVIVSLPGIFSFPFFLTANSVLSLFWLFLMYLLNLT